jgi:hypothetical protein
MLTVEAAASEYITILRTGHAPVATVRACAAEPRRFTAGVAGDLAAVNAAAVRRARLVGVGRLASAVREDAIVFGAPGDRLSQPAARRSCVGPKVMSFGFSETT